MIKRYHKSILTFIGLCLFATYFWMRFLRTRNPKELPLYPSLLGFFILVEIVCLFAYIILSLLFFKSSNPYIEKIIGILFIPIKELNKSSYKKYHEAFLIKIFSVFEFLINKTNLFFIIFWIIPRIILLCILSLDIFVYATFENRYKFIFISIFLLFNRCFRYSFKNTKDQLYNYVKPFVESISTKYYHYVLPKELTPDFDADDPSGGLL